MGLENMLTMNNLGDLQFELPIQVALSLSALDEAGCEANEDTNSQLQLLLQAQALLNKSSIYQRIDQALQGSHVFRPMVYENLLNGDACEDHVTKLHRDAAVNNIRFLNIFYGYSADVFLLAVNLLDRLLGRVKAQTRYLSCVATSCFYIAARTQEKDVFIPGATELVKLSQCGGTVSDLMRMENLILDKLQWQVEAVTPQTFLRNFHELLLSDEDSVSYNLLAGRLEVLLCQFEFTKFRAETLALSIVSEAMMEKGLLDKQDKFSAVIELQYYCQISDAEFLQCRQMLTESLAMYKNQRSRLPRMQLTWTVSRRTLTKMKPSTRVLLDLEPIMEDEDFDCIVDDTCPFDSENDDNEMEKYSELMRSIQPPARIPDNRKVANLPKLLHSQCSTPGQTGIGDEDLCPSPTGDNDIGVGNDINM